MYTDFYGFSERPFEITPDPKFLYQGQEHCEVLASLVYGIKQRRGFIVVVGEVGTGKTTLLWSLLDRLTKDVKVANIFNTDITFDDMLHMVLVDLELTGETERLGKVEALQRLNALAIQQLRNGGNVLIMVDEAQNLDGHCMENLRLLTNLETRKHKLLQIILSGQPELEEKLNRPELRQVSQRINVKRYLLPFDETETYAYIRHRLKVAHYSGAALFTDEAQRLIWEYSEGIPRKINTVCDNALLTGYALDERKIGLNTVREVIGDLSRNFFVERAKITPASTSNPEPQPGVKAPPAATITSESQALQRPSWSIQLREVIGDLYCNFFVERAKITPASTPILLFVLLLTLLTGVGLVTRHFHWNENSAPALPGNFPAATTEVGKKLVESPVAPPRPESTASEAVHPGAVLETYRETSANITPQPPPEPIQLEALPPPDGEEKIPKPTEKTPPAVEAQEPTEAGPSPYETTLVVRDGENLSKIIIRNFGMYDKIIEQEILKVNPDIKNPDLVYPDQTITIPSLLLVPKR